MPKPKPKPRRRPAPTARPRHRSAQTKPPAASAKRKADRGKPSAKRKRKPRPQPAAAADRGNSRSLSRSFRRRFDKALAPVLRACTADEAQLLALLASRATDVPASLDDLAALTTSDAEASGLAALTDRLRQVAASGGDAHRERARIRASALSAAAREIGPLPEVEDPERKADCEWEFARFCKVYHPDWFPLEWSESQLQAIALIEETVLRGGLHADALERGVGKTTLCIAAIEWAILYGHHQYALLLGANDDKAAELLDAVKLDLETNRRLLEDFPEVCHPIVRLEGIVNRCKGQTLHGEPTGLEWRGHKKIVLPSVPGSRCPGAVLKAAGWGSAVRGAVHTTRDGRRIRPSLLLMDDLQTDESARSPGACDKLLRVVKGGLLGVAGPGQKISAMFPCTIIEPGDAADQLTDREKNPEWHGQRSSMIRSWPERLDLWEQYHELRQDGFRANRTAGGEARETDDPAPGATAFYAAQREAMDAGFTVSWPARKLPWELSPQQHAMNLYFRDRVAFFSEYQNLQMTERSPAHPLTQEELRLDPDVLAAKCSGYARGLLPAGAAWVTAFVDCHDRVLYWMVCAWGTDFSGWIVDYGTFPETRRTVFYAGSFSPTLQQKFAGTGLEGALTAGLDGLTESLLTRRFRRTDGAELPVNLQLIDTGYQSKTVRSFIDASRFLPRVQSSFGKALGPDETPFSAYKQRPGERIGDDWLIRKAQRSAHRSQHVVFEANAWKTFAARRLLTAIGDPGCVSVFGVPQKDAPHAFLARHLSAEQARAEEGRVKINAWARRPGETENHWWDCFVGTCVAASILGAKLGGDKTVGRQRLSLIDLQKQKRRQAA